MALAYSIPTYTSVNAAVAATNSLAPHNVLWDPMMSAVNPTVIAYIANMVSRQV